VDLSTFAYGPASNKAQGSFYASSYSNEEGFAAGLVMLKNLGVKKVAEVLANVPSMQAAQKDIVTPTAQKLGLTVTPVSYNQPADWATLAATIVSSNPDAVNLFATEPDCLAAIPALPGSRASSWPASACRNWPSSIPPSSTTSTSAPCTTPRR
jgi:hypothetical protein